MALFASDRERRLWLATLAVLVAIYSTLGLARTVAGALRTSGLLVASFVTGMALVVATVAILGLRRRAGGAEIGVALGLCAAYLLVLVRMATPEERTHLIEYGVVGVLIHEALTERRSRGRAVSLPALTAVLLTGVAGVLDESIQSLLPSRVFDPRDMLFNLLAGGMAVGASVLLRRVRRQAG